MLTNHHPQGKLSMLVLPNHHPQGKLSMLVLPNHHPQGKWFVSVECKGTGTQLRRRVGGIICSMKAGLLFRPILG